MLRNEVGDERWWAGIRKYYRKYMNSHVTTDDFRDEMEAVCDCDLKPFFAQWLYQGGNILMDGEWHYDHSTDTVEVVLSPEKIDGSNFTVDVEIGIFGNDDLLPSVHRIPLTGAGGRLSIPFAEKPERVVIDPRTVLLAEWSFTEKAK